MNGRKLEKMKFISFISNGNDKLNFRDLLEEFPKLMDNSKKYMPN